MTHLFDRIKGRENLSKRKNFLFDLACIETIEHLLIDPRSKNALQIARAWLDNSVSDSYLIYCAGQARLAYDSSFSPKSLAAHAVYIFLASLYDAFRFPEVINYILIAYGTQYKSSLRRKIKKQQEKLYLSYYTDIFGD